VQGAPQADGGRVGVSGRKESGVDAVSDHVLDCQHDGAAGALVDGDLARRAGRPRDAEQYLVDVGVADGELAVRPCRRAQPGGGVAVLGYGLVEVVCQPGEVPLIDCPTTGGSVQEYAWQGGDPWIQGQNLAGSAGTSRAAAVHWQKDYDHLRLYYQDADNLIKEECYDTPDWGEGQTFTGSAYAGTGIAALALFNPRNKSIHLMLYYQASQAASYQIVEQYWDGDTRNGWVPSHAFQGALPGTGIAAVYFIDESNNPHKRLYYQDTNNLCCRDVGIAQTTAKW
jgi:hypothetical protein